MKYEYTEEMREISGFGGGYEATCRKMVVAGLEWFDTHPEADVRFSRLKNVDGVIWADTDDAKELEAAVVAVSDDCTGAMVQWSIAHVQAARRLGWDAYAEKMREMKREEEQEAHVGK